MGILKELLNLAQSQIGYQEKQSAYLLDDFRANAGYRNYTKYSRDVSSWGLMGLPGAALVCHLPVLAGGKGFWSGYGTVTFLHEPEQLPASTMHLPIRDIHRKSRSPAVW